jgi:thioredoxin-related protein
VTGFPTLVFTDSSGKMKYKVVGYKPTLEFAAELAKALKALEIKPSEEMQKLIDKKVLKVD